MKKQSKPKKSGRKPPQVTKSGRKKTIKLNRYEKCLIVLARHIERCPYCEYKVEEQILEELGYVKE